MAATDGAIHREMTAGEWGVLLALGGIWGGAFFFTAVAVRELPPTTIVALRVGLAAAALQLWLTFRGGRPRIGGRLAVTFLVMGLLNNVVPFSLIVWGQTAIAGGLAAILNAATPIFGVVVAHFLTADEKMSANRALGVALGAFGVAVLIGPEALAGLGGAETLPHQLAILAATLSYALAGVYGRRFRRLGVPPLEAAAGQITAAALVTAPIALLIDRPYALPAPSLETVLAVLGLALLCTAFAYGLYFRLLATAGASNILLVTLVVPPAALVLGALVLGEAVGWLDLAGLGLIALGLAAIDGRPLRAAFGRRTA